MSCVPGRNQKGVYSAELRSSTVAAEKSEQLGGISFVASEPFPCVLSHLDPPFNSSGFA